MYRILLLLVIFSLSGCVMLPEEFYSPKSENGENIRSLCYGGVGPKDTLKLQLDGVDIRLSVNNIKVTEDDVIQEFIRRYEHLEGREDILSYAVHVQLNIPKGYSVFWLQPSIEFRVDSGEVATGFIYRFSSYRNDSGKVDSKDTPVSSELIGSSWTYGKSKYPSHKRYSGRIWLGPDNFNKIELGTLKLEINNKIWSIVGVEFIKDSGWYMYPLNC